MHYMASTRSKADNIIYTLSLVGVRESPYVKTIQVAGSLKISLISSKPTEATLFHTKLYISFTVILHCTYLSKT